MFDPQGVATKEKEFAPGKRVPSTGAYLAHFILGGWGPGELTEGRKFPSKLGAHEVKYWTEDDRSDPSQANPPPGDPATRTGLYRATLVVGGTRDKRFERGDPLPKKLGTLTVREWKFLHP